MKNFVAFFIFGIFSLFAITVFGQEISDNDTARTSTDRSTVIVPDDVADINEAFRRVADGGTIRVKPGVHRVNGTITVDKNIRLIGEGAKHSDTILESANGSVLIINTEHFRAESLTFRVKAAEPIEPVTNVFLAPYSPDHTQGMTETQVTQRLKEEKTYSAVVVLRGNPKFTRCGFTSNRGHGLFVATKDAAPSFVESCFFESQVGIYIPAGTARLEKSSIRDNHRIGIVVWGETSSITMIDCSISDNFVFGILVSDNANGTFRGCEVYGHRGAGMMVSDHGKGTFEGCEAFKNLAGMMVMLGGDPTVLDSKFFDNPSAGMMVLANGKGTFEGCEAFRNTAGIYIAGAGASPVVRNSKFYDNAHIKGNVAAHFSGGIVVLHAGGTFERCESFRNSAGIIVGGDSDPVVRNSKFYDNVNVEDNFIARSQSGGIYIFGGKGTFDECEVYGNGENGILIKSDGSPTVRNSRIRDNGHFGISIRHSGRGTFENNTLSGNASGNWHLVNPGEIVRVGNTDDNAGH